MESRSKVIETKGQAVASFLKWSGLTNESEETITRFLDALKRHQYEQGDYIIREGESGRNFYIIDEGSVSIQKESDKGEEISRLYIGDFFGELALITEAPRLASVKAVEPVAVYSISQEQFENLARQNPRIYGRILKNLYDRLKDSYIDLEVTNEQLEVVHQEKDELSLLFVAIVMLISTYAFIINLFQADWFLRLPDPNTVQYTVGRLVEITGLALIMLVVNKSRMPLSAFGITLKDWKKSVKESIWFTLVGMAVLTAIAYVVVYDNQGRLIQWEAISWEYFAYIFVVPIQEFIMRGVFQNSVYRLLTGKYVGVLAVLITSLVFGALHLHVSVNLGIIAFVSGLFWGFLYLRHQSLLGICLSHYILGNYADLIGLWDKVA